MVAKSTDTDKRMAIELIEGPIVDPAKDPGPSGAGAVVQFLGVVRPLENDRALRGLRYSSYDPMAQRELAHIARQAVDRHGLVFVQILHSVGFVGVGEASLCLAVSSKHRKPALAAMDEILDALKRDVPIWKNPVYDEPAPGGGGRV